jgi:molybdopterin molybdotransferase
MIGVDEALSLVLDRARPGPQRTLPLRQAVGHVLAEDIACSLDSPPYDKSLVDGYAVQSSDCAAAGRVLRVLEQVTAGRVPQQRVTAGTATRIMTGAPIPGGADAVVMIERTALVPGGEEAVRIEMPVRPDQNIMRRGESMRVGQTVLRRGHALRAIETGLLAELGVSAVHVFSRPTVAVLATGDELVSCHEIPAAGQIRNSNGPLLEQLVVASGCPVRDLGVARDTEPELNQRIAEGLQDDVLLLSGGVSAGVLDLVPHVLKQRGAVEVFHQVQMRPGRPLWFGFVAGEGSDKLVFGLPGNPVSALVCFHLFVRPGLARLAGRAGEGLCRATAVMTRDYQHRSDRPTWHPGRAHEQDGAWRVEPLDWRGSADLRTLADANVLIQFAPGPRTIAAGQSVVVWLL